MSRHQAWLRRAIVVAISLFPALVSVAQNVDMGPHYDHLESEAVRVVTEFEDGQATAMRAEDGSVHAAFTRRGLNVGSLTIAGRGEVTVLIDRPGAAPKRLHGRLDVPQGLDWANVQVARLWRDVDRAHGTEPSGALVREGAYFRLNAERRPRGIASTSEGELRVASARSVTTYFPEYVARSVQVSENDARRPTFTSTLRSNDDAVQLAQLWWSEPRRTMQWKLRGKQTATITAEHLPKKIDWQPNLAWANVQLHALARAEKHAAAEKQLRADGVTDGNVETLDTVGCDGLHWLDNTIYRPCCDRHDACYAKNGCTWRSWWFQGSWKCIQCNIAVIICFATGGGGGGPEELRDDGGSDDGFPSGPGCPIILDLDEDTYRLTSLPAGVSFDIWNTGQRVAMAWTRPNVETAFLAMDRNGNGRIDSGAELFGDYTPLQSGGLAWNGFDALRELDANQDEVIDASDAVWQRLLLWTDRNHDGNSSPNELRPIAGSPVVALETDYRRIGRKDQWGNELRYTSHFRIRNGAATARRPYYDAFFVTAE